jgi:hypothetical protein
MSDGPHRSLPLRRHWKSLLERIITPSFSSHEVVEALSNALISDLREAPVAEVLRILQGDGQPSLFHENCAEQLEAIRRTCPGSTPGNILLECAIEANANGLTGHQAALMTLENVFDALFQSARNSIEEHCKRKEPWSGMNIRTRLKDARKDVSLVGLISEVMPGMAATNNKHRLAKRTGLDDGPRL